MSIAYALTRVPRIRHWQWSTEHRASALTVCPDSSCSVFSTVSSGFCSSFPRQMLKGLVRPLWKPALNQWRRKWQPTPVFFPGESHGRRGLVGYSLWGWKESDTTKQLTHTHTHTHPPTEDIAAYWFPSNEEYSFKLRREKSLGGIWELSFV